MHKANEESSWRKRRSREGAAGETHPHLQDLRRACRLCRPTCLHPRISIWTKPGGRILDTSGVTPRGKSRTFGRPAESARIPQRRPRGATAASIIHETKL